MSSHRERGRRPGLARRAVGAIVSIAIAGTTYVGVSAPPAAADYPDSDFEVDRHDLEFILNQIQIAESHAGGGELLCPRRDDMSWTCVPDPKLPYGLRTVDGSFNNLFEGRSKYGASGQQFRRLLEPSFRTAGDLTFDPDGPAGPAQSGVSTSYAQKSGFVSDPEPRVISNLIVDQTESNPAAAEAAASVPGAVLQDHDADPATPQQWFIPNRAPDEGLSAPFNSWFTLFGQFFDHGLDLVSKGGSGTVAVPLQPDDPLYDADSPRTNFIFLTRATNLPGNDGVLGTGDDVQEHTNRTTPFVDQNQTYTSHPSHQVFLREYETLEDGTVVPTGRLLDRTGGDGLPNWAEIKTQASEVLGIDLSDADVTRVPLVLTDPYGHFVPGENGLPQLVVAGENGEQNSTLEGRLEAPVAASQAIWSGHAFLDDIAHNADPTGKTADEDDTSNPVEVPLPSGQYDDELLDKHYLTGDGRGNENIGLTSVHHVFHSEHNRLVGHIEDVLATQDQAFQDRWHATDGVWGYGERIFQAARYVTEMQYQHLVFEEFARKLQPSIDAGPLNESLYHADINPAVTAEFAHVVYRFGHSMLTDVVDRTGFETEPLPLLDAFLNPDAFTDNGRLSHDEGSAAVIQGMMNQTGSGIDEFVVDTLRNNLLGLPLDLATINMARARDTGVPGLQAARRMFYKNGLNSALKPYDSWEDFRLSMKNRGSIVNFVAAYGNHPSVRSATTVSGKRTAAQALVADQEFMNAPAAQTGVEDIDFWVGGLAERAMVFGGMLGTTFNAVFEEHMENLQNGDRFYYLNRNQGLNLFHQLEANSFSELVMRNTDARNLPVDAFASQDLTVQLPPVAPVEHLTQMPNGTWRWDGPEHITLHGTEEADKMQGGEGDDALWSHGGDDDVEGGVGNDGIHGGPGDDTLTDLFGDDTIHAGPGADAVNGGAGLDILFGQSGSDFIIHGEDPDQSFAGQGTDFIRGGDAGDVMTGNELDDWMEGDRGADLVQGDNALTFQNDPVGGADILGGGPGNDDHDAEGGDDVMLNNGRDRHAGMLGFDWVTHKGDPDPVDADLDVLIFQPPNVTLMRSRFMNVEGLSGWDGPDILRGKRHPGDQSFPTTGKGHELTQAHLDRVEGLRQMLGGGEIPRYATPFLATNQTNNIIIGGPGSDLIEGRSGDDFLDGDAALDVYLQLPGGERAESMLDVHERVFARELHPSEIAIKRAILSEPDDAIDTAHYEDVRANHTITDLGDGIWRVAHAEEDAGGLSSGVDILQNIERIRFADEVVDLGAFENGAASGALEFSTLQPVEDEEMSVTPDLFDPQGIQEDTLSLTWQWGDDESEWTPSENGTGTTFTPGDAEAGWPLRVVATFLDGEGTLETITSQATLPTRNVNDAPTGLVVDNTAPRSGDTIRASGLVDLDGTHNDDGDVTVQFLHTWQRNAGNGWTDIQGARGAAYTVTDADMGAELRVRVRYTDNLGTAEDVTSPGTAAVPMEKAPGAPGIASVTPGRTSAVVTFTTPADDGNSEILGYAVQVISGGEVQRTITGIGPDENSVEVTGLAPGTAYRFGVLAINRMGSSPVSELSDPVEVTGEPAPPENQPVEGEAVIGLAGGGRRLTVDTSRLTDGDGLGAMRFAWSRLEDRDRWTAIPGATGRSLPVSDAVRGRVVRVEVTFEDGAGGREQLVSRPLTVPQTVPGAPTIRKVRAGKPQGEKTAYVVWSAPATTGGSRVAAYKVTVVSARGGKIRMVRTVGAGTRQLTVTLRPGSYRFRVSAVNGVGTSPAALSQAVRAR